MLVNSGKSSALKGDRGMKERYSMFKFVFASLACCLLAAAMITGCGGGNNPAGPESGAVVTDPVTNSLAPGQFNILGKVVSDGTSPVGSVTVKLFVQDSTTGAVVDSGRTSLSLTCISPSFSEQISPRWLTASFIRCATQ